MCVGGTTGTSGPWLGRAGVGWGGEGWGTGPYGGRDDSERMAGRQTGRLTERSGKERKIDGLIQPRRQEG